LNLELAASMGTLTLRRSVLLLAIAVVVCGAIGGILVILDRHPIHVSLLDDNDLEAPATDAFRANASPVLLISSLEDLCLAAHGQNFDAMDWSLAWINLLEQECGYYAHVEYVQLSPDTWSGRSLVIVAHSAIPRFTEAQIESLKAFVREGGVVILDRPSAKWLSMSGIALGPAEAGEARIRGAHPDVLVTRVAEALDRVDLPFPIAIHRLDGSVPEDVRTLFRFDDRPALLERALGDGVVLSTTFDLGRLLVTVQQGRPEPDYTVRKKWGFYGHVLETHDLVWHRSYLENTIPAADVLERAILAAVRRHGPLPVWWAFPDLAMGLLLMTHDEDEKGAEMCRLLLDHERKINARATYFLMTGPRVTDGWPPDAVRRYAELGADLSFHWNRLPWQTGIWKLEPVSRVFALADQIDFYRAALANGGVRPGPLLNRNHYLMWAAGAAFRAGTTHYTRTFRTLYRHGVVMDSSYGPNRQARGYLFGTGRPFYPMDVDGKRIPIWEMPFVSQENWGGEDENWFRRLFTESHDRYHTAICCIFHPHIIVREDAGNKLWKSVYAIAANYGHPALTFRDYYNFLEGRRTSGLGWQVLGKGRLQIQCEAEIEGLSVAIRGSPVRVSLDGQPLAKQRSISLDGHPFTLLPVSAGKHTLVVEFDTP